MRKIKNDSAQFKVNFPKQPQPNQNATKNKNKLTKDRQELINKIAADGFKDFENRI